MKFRQTLFVSLCLLLCGTLRAEISAQAWLETYYLDPRPAEIPNGILRLSHEGFFDRTENIAVAIGFIATLFAQHSGEVDRWLLQFNGLPVSHHRLLACALWQAGHPLGPDVLRAFGRTSSLRSEIEQIANRPSQTVLDTPVQSASSMRLQWGAFLATGDESYVLRILDVFGSDAGDGLTSAVRLSLAQNAAAHPRVLEICRAQLERQPEEVRNELRAALRHAERAPPPGASKG